AEAFGRTDDPADDAIELRTGAVPRPVADCVTGGAAPEQPLPLRHVLGDGRTGERELAGKNRHRAGNGAVRLHRACSSVFWASPSIWSITIRRTGSSPIFSARCHKSIISTTKSPLRYTDASPV